MNYHHLAASVLLTLSTILPSESIRGDFVQKSLQRATFECSQYLAGSSECQARCEALVLRSWNDSTGLQYIAYSRHFRPNQNDVTYLNRTLQCLDERLESKSCGPVCSKASIYKQCYMEQWGNLVRTPQLVPMPRLVTSRIVSQCADMLQLTPQEVWNFAFQKYDVSDRSRCFLRCLLMRQGLFSGDGEPNIDRLYVQCGGYNVDEASFKRNATECSNRIRSKGYDSCMVITRIVNDCFPPDSGALLESIIQGIQFSGVPQLEDYEMAFGIAMNVMYFLDSVDIVPFLLYQGIPMELALEIYYAARRS